MLPKKGQSDHNKIEAFSGLFSSSHIGASHFRAEHLSSGQFITCLGGFSYVKAGHLLAKQCLIRVKSCSVQSHVNQLMAISAQRKVLSAGLKPFEKLRMTSDANERVKPPVDNFIILNIEVKAGRVFLIYRKNPDLFVPS